MPINITIFGCLSSASIWTSFRISDSKSSVMTGSKMILMATSVDLQTPCLITLKPPWPIWSPMSSSSYAISMTPGTEPMVPSSPDVLVSTLAFEILFLRMSSSLISFLLLLRSSLRSSSRSLIFLTCVDAVAGRGPAELIQSFCSSNDLVAEPLAPLHWQVRAAVRRFYFLRNTTSFKLEVDDRKPGFDVATIGESLSLSKYDSNASWTFLTPNTVDSSLLLTATGLPSSLRFSSFARSLMSSGSTLILFLWAYRFLSLCSAPIFPSDMILLSEMSRVSSWVNSKISSGISVRPMPEMSSFVSPPRLTCLILSMMSLILIRFLKYKFQLMSL